MYASRPNFVPLKVVFGTTVKRDHKVLGYSVSRVTFKRNDFFPFTFMEQQ